MKITELLRPENVLAELDAASKPQLLQRLAEHAARATGKDGAALLGALSHRETLGSTGIGQSIAIPHASIPGLDRPFALLARLDRPVEFDAIDEQPVDLVFLLLTPADRTAHLKVLSTVSRQLRSAQVLEQLRRASSAAQMYAAITAEI
ncbi:PTS sugar transporter subunit IIA [Devosia sp.]|uniref:PTS sugar transporter subunit IIA n=1 Tax=Devosia sp. TaxID=1871048 RepID=UPI003F705FFB